MRVQQMELDSRLEAFAAMKWMGEGISLEQSSIIEEGG